MEKLVREKESRAGEKIRKGKRDMMELNRTSHGYQQMTQHEYISSWFSYFGSFQRKIKLLIIAELERD